MDLFHFALREGGVLLLGAAETVGETHGRFTAVSKIERVFRHTARGRPGDFRFLGGDGVRVPARWEQGTTSPRGEFSPICANGCCWKNYAPAAVLINRNNECLYSTGPTDLYLSVAPGQATHDLLAMARKGLGCRLRSAIQRAFDEKAPRHPSASVGWITRTRPPCRISVRPVVSDGEELALVCFPTKRGRREEQGPVAGRSESLAGRGTRQELEATRIELQDAMRDLEIAGEEQKAINEEALSVNEEFQSDQRGIADLQGGVAIAQRRADRAQQPASGDARPAAHHVRRFAKCALQHRCRDDLSRR